MILTVTEFRRRFSLDEKRRIYAAAETVVDIRIWLDDLASVKDSEVDTADPEMIAAIMGLEAAGLLDSGRTANDILGTTLITTNGALSVGDMVAIKPPFGDGVTACPVEGFDGDVVLVNGGAYSMDYLEAV